MESLLIKTLRKVKSYKILICFSLLLFCLLLSLAVILPLSFDDAVFMKTAKNLSKSGLYAYDSLFDPIVTTGFPVILPTAIVYRVLPNNIIGARIVSVTYFMLLMALVYRVTRQYGFTKKDSFKVLILTIFICLFTIPNFIITSLGLYGEVPAVGFFLSSLIFLKAYLKTKQFQFLLLCGMFVGLAFSTKYIMFFAFPAVIVALVFANLKAGKKTLTISLLILLIGIIVPEAVFRLYHYLTVGEARFMEDLKQLSLYYQNLNSLTNLERPTNSIFFDHLLSLKEQGISPLAPITYFFFACASLVYSIRHRKHTLTAMVIFVILIYFRWLFFTHNTLMRHLFTGMFVFNVIFSAFIISYGKNILEGRNKAKLITIITFLIAIFMTQASLRVFLNYNVKIHVYRKMSQEQKRIADFIRSQNNADFYHLPWYLAPEYSLLADKSFKTYFPTSKPDTLKNNFLILTPKALKLRTCYPNKIVFSSYNFLICKL